MLSIRPFSCIIKKQYDSKCKVQSVYREGDLVYIPHNAIPGQSSKLQAQFKGPYTIKKVLPNNRYVITDLEGFQQTQLPFTGIFDPSNMKLWKIDDL